MKFKLTLLSISFLEGAALMSYEVISSKIYTPYLGSTVYVWTSILSMTLLGLALGYRSGDKVSLSNARKALAISLFASAGFIALANPMAGMLFGAMTDLEVRIASFVAGVVLLLVPMFLLGRVSPILIHKLSTSSSNVGSYSGLIYGLGTIAGVIVSMLLVFYSIPVIGVQSSLWLISGLLVLAGIIAITRLK